MARRTRLSQELTVLAQVRATLTRGNRHLYLDRFRRFGGTPRACVDGHPEVEFIQDADAAGRLSKTTVEDVYHCPACDQDIAVREPVADAANASRFPGAPKRVQVERVGE